MYMNSIISNPWWRPPLHFPEMMKFVVGLTRERSVPPRSEVMWVPLIPNKDIDTSTIQIIGSLWKGK